jgi:hypothetical protein
MPWIIEAWFAASEKMTQFEICPRADLGEQLANPDRSTTHADRDFDRKVTRLRRAKLLLLV